MAVIKRYSNRKLYDTDTKRYVTLDDVADSIRRGEDVRVVDHVTGEDLTSVTLLQILFEEQKRIGGLLPGVFLARVIQAGGDTVNAVRSRLLGLDPFQTVDEEITRRVKALVENGELAMEEGQRLIGLLVRKPEQPAGQADVIHIPVRGEDDSEVTAAAVESGDQPDPAEVEALLRQVEELERTLAELKK